MPRLTIAFDVHVITVIVRVFDDPQTVRGIGPALFLFDEMAHAKMAFFLEVIVPILGVKNTVFIGVSSPLEENNFFNTLMTLTDERINQKVFNTLEQTTVCEVCLQQRNMNCTHLAYMIPPWKDPSLIAITANIYRALGQDEVERMELYGLTGQPFGGVVDANAVDDMFDKPKFIHNNKRPPDFVFVGHDPNAGGECHTGLCALCFIDGQIIIMGLYDEKTDYLKQKKDIPEFFNKIRQHPYLENSTIVYIGESNTGHVSGWTADKIGRRVPNFYAMRGKDDGNPGVFTTADTREEQIFAMINCVEDSNVLVADDMVVVGGQDPKAIVDELRSEIKRMRRIPPKNGINNRGYRPWSARVDAMGREREMLHDDMLDAFSMAVVFGRKFRWRDPRYYPTNLRFNNAERLKSR